MTSETITTIQPLDLRGKTITTYILTRVVDAFGDMGVGDSIEVITDDFEPIEHDVAAWCRMTGHELLDLSRADGEMRLTLAKGEARAVDRKLAVVIGDAGLFELLSPLGFALGAALEGVDVHIYFQGPAVKILASGFKAKAHGLMRPISVFPRRGLAQAGHVGAQEKLRELRKLGAHFYACGPSMQHFKVSRDDLAFDDVPVVEYLTFMEVMVTADVQFFTQ